MSTTVTRREFLRLMAVAAAGSVLAACKPEVIKETVVVEKPVEKIVKETVIVEKVATAMAGPRRGGTLIDGRVVAPVSLDPFREGLLASRQVIALLYDPLVDIDRGTNPIPCLAESWEAVEPTHYVFKLRQGVKFHNGKELDSDDVKASFDHYMDPEVKSWRNRYIQSIAEVKATDKYTVDIYLSEPYAALPPNLWQIYIVPKSLIDGPADALKSTAVGTGAWILDMWDEATKMVLKRNPDYWKPGLPYLDEVVLQWIPDETSAIAALRTGQIHHLLLGDNRNVATLVGSPDIQIQQTAGLGTNYNQINFRKEEMANLEVRQALSLALDREAILQAAGGGIGQVSGALPTSFKDFWIPAEDLPYYTRDIPKAKSLLAEAGYPDGFEMTIITVSTIPLMDITAQMMASQWGEIGIECTIESDEVTTWVNKKNKPPFDWHVACNLEPTAVDPDIMFGVFDTTQAVAIQGDFTFPELDRLLAAGRKESDKEKRIEIYREAQLLAAELQPVFFTYTPVKVDAVRSNVKGFEGRSDDMPRAFDQTWLE